MLLQHIKSAIHGHFTLFDKTLVTLNLGMFFVMCGLISQISNNHNIPEFQKPHVLAVHTIEQPTSVPTSQPTTTQITATVTPVVIPEISRSQSTPIPSTVPAITESTPSQQTTPFPQATQIPTPEQSSSATASDNPSIRLFEALNTYRQKKGKHPLIWDDTLAQFSQGRADSFAQNGSLDNHSGFQTMMNENGFEKMGFNALGENSGWTDNTDPIYVIESLYGGHAPHDVNQLESKWSHVGIGANGSASNVVFGGNKR